MRRAASPLPRRILVDSSAYFALFDERERPRSATILISKEVLLCRSVVG
jgi:hypothetical protein